MSIVSLVNFYPCWDIEQTTAFYLNVMGLSLYLDQGKARIFDTGYGYLGFCEYEDKQLATKTCISFNVESIQEVDNYYLKFKELKLNDLIKPCMHPQFSVYSCFLKDPNGYRLEIQKIV